MTDLIARLAACLCLLFIPGRGKHRASTTPDETPAVRVICARPIPLHVLARSMPAREEFRIPRYLLAWERQRECEWQRERRIAAALATMGIDYPYGPVPLTASCAVSA
ncbi:hypothetical protein ACH4FX_08740 [Streptomyces sp. NPDC018019]|uniref:hypothetical protein n=1 Tax=Streptomyces sp. NPDC018019 TaxID=3365030 RepID=UPI00379C9844